MILVVAFVFAAAALYLVKRVLQNQAVAVRPSATMRVVAANADIKLGTVLTLPLLKTIEVGTVPKGAILANDESKAVGRGVISDIYEGEPIMESRLAAVGAGGGLAPAIPMGMRASAVRVDEVVGVSGFVTPGMRVDVIVSGIPPGINRDNSQGTVAKTLLQNIQVLSAGTEYQKDNEGKAKPVQVVNLLVTPEQAETLTLASNLKIQLVLRNPLDTKTDPVLGTSTGTIFTGLNSVPAGPKHTVAKRVRPHAFSIEVLNGSTQSDEKFASPEGHQ
jgi:pilus assembly protein CpaB